MIDTTSAKTMLQTVAQSGGDAMHAATNSSAQVMSGMSFSVADIAIIALILLSTVIGLWRGFVKETLSLFVWVLAVWVALTYSNDMSTYFVNHVHHEGVRYYLSFAILMIVTLIIGGIVNMLLVGIIRKIGLGFLDRTMGLIFGFARGVLVIALLLILLKFFDLSSAGWWQDSAIIPYFSVVMNVVHGVIFAV